MRYCKNCGLLVPHDADRCPQCGTPLPPEPVAAAPAHTGARYTDESRPAPEAVVPALSEWATLGTLLLFSIPIAGFILSLAWSFGFSKHPARKRLAQAWLIRTMIVAVVFTLVCIALALTSVVTLTATPYYYAF